MARLLGALRKVRQTPQFAPVTDPNSEAQKNPSTHMASPTGEFTTPRTRPNVITEALRTPNDSGDEGNDSIDTKSPTNVFTVRNTSGNPANQKLPNSPTSSFPNGAPSESAKLSAQLDKLNQPASLKEQVAKAALSFAPTALAGAFGGLAGAAGAAQGVNIGLEAQQAQKQAEQKSLIARVEAARQREQQASEFSQTLQERKDALTAENLRNQRTVEAENARAAANREAEDRRAANALVPPAEREYQAWLKAVGAQDTQESRTRYRLLGSKLTPGETTVTGFDQSGAPTTFTAPEKPRVQVPGVDIPLPASVEAQRIRMAQAEKTAQDTGDVSALADMVVQNPDLLKTLNPTVATKVLGAVAKSGRTIQNPKTGMVSEMVDKALNTVDYLKKNMSVTGGGYGAVGAKGPSSLFGILSEPLPGTAARDYRSYIDALKSQVTLPNLDMLRGMGRVTDREFKALSDAMTALNPSMSESQFMKELGTIETTLNAIKDREGGAQQQAPAIPAQQGWKIISVK